jgi:hypothetical protein
MKDTGGDLMRITALVVVCYWIGNRLAEIPIQMLFGG